MKKTLAIVGAITAVAVIAIFAFTGGVMVGNFAANQDGDISGVTNSPGECPTVDCNSVSESESLDGTATDDPNLPSSTPDTEALPDWLVNNDAQLDYELLKEVLDLLDQQFYGEIPNQAELTHGAIRGMLTTLDDQYTSFIDPEITAILNEDSSGEYQGIGAFVNLREDGYLEIASLIEGAPAETSGLKPGDIVLAVGDQSLVGLGLYEAISYIRGPAGTEAVLEVVRQGESESLYITIVRAAIEVPITTSERLDNNIAYIQLTEFDANATSALLEEFDSVVDEDTVGLIFDLRGNPGGWLDQAISVADIFLDKGVVAYQRDSSGGERQFNSDSGDIGETIPIVILVNGGTASASEIVAGAVQDRGRGVLIGTQTVGKGSVQIPNDLTDGSQLRVTIAHWYTPNEQELHGNGLTPDIVVEFPLDTPDNEDPQLDRAIEYLLNGE